MEALKSSSPALRGSSSKSRYWESALDAPVHVIIPCVAGQFFEEKAEEVIASV